MKRNQKIPVPALLATVAFVSVSCIKDSGILPAGEAAMDFDIVFPLSRASSTAFEPGDCISLFAVEQPGERAVPLQIAGNYINNERLSFDGSVWSAAKKLYWSDVPCDFYAVYPYQKEISSIDDDAFSLVPDQNVGYQENDLMYACAEGWSRVNGPVYLQFSHMLSKCNVTIVKGENFEGEIPDDIEVHIYNTVTDVRLDWTKGSAVKDPYGSRHTITMRKLDREHFDAIVVPQNIEKRTPLIEVSMGGIAYLLEYSLSFRPGMEHTIRLTVNTSPDQEMIEISIDPSINNN